MPALDRLFGEAAARFADAVALRHGESTLTYRQLDERSSRFAHWLANEGVSQGDRVGLCLDRGPSLAVAVLGVLKAGAAYVPLDPTFPRARLAMMVRDCGAARVVTSLRAETLFVDEPAVRRWQELEPLLEDLPADRPTVEVEAATAAYLIYTSGSTGRPKGVVMPHGALANLIEWQIAQPGFEKPARTLQFTPLSFDVHAQELFSTWCTGGELVLVDDPVRRDAGRLLRLLADTGVERLFLPFVALQQLAEVAVTVGPLPESLREVVTAGEQLQVNRYVREFFGRLPACRLHNHYGPSETHVVTAHTLEGPAGDWPTLPPIGRPITGARVHLLDEELDPVPAGEVGELCVAGACLATGYWNRAALTDGRFVRSIAGEERIYRTGDLAREAPDGALEFLGRMDGQLKIRGHRVEAGEIEVAISEHPLVRECAVVGRGESAVDRKLIAYLVLDGAAPGAPDVGAARLAERREQWREVWDSTYGQRRELDDPTFDVAGWSSSFTGDPLPTKDMRAWVEGAVEGILRCEPRRVLEVGCGTGLVLLRVAPHCERYLGIDFSPVAIEGLRRVVDQHAPDAPIELEVMAADEIRTLRDQPFDTVVINSVTQHLSGSAELLRLLQDACSLVERGRVFVGDVTSAHLRETFVTAVEGARAEGGESVEALRGRIERRLGEEFELVVHPDFFRGLQDQIDGLCRVEIQLKPGRYRNELSDYRYDVTLHLEPEPEPERREIEIDWLDWAGLDLDRLKTRMLDDPTLCLGLRGVPNVRMAEASAGLRALLEGGALTVTEWRAAAKRVLGQSDPGLDPSDFRDLEAAAPYAVDVVWSEDPACFDVLLRPAALRQTVVQAPKAPVGVPLARLTSQPWVVASMQQVVSELRESLAALLPEPMLPVRYVLLSRLPTTPSGKLDRRALPAPSRARPTLGREYAAPRGATEEALAALWGELLDLEQVGAEDSFFDLGGNSILSVRLALAVRDEMARELPVLALFEHPTLRALASYLDRGGEIDARDGDAAERGRRQASALRRGRPFNRK